MKNESLANVMIKFASVLPYTNIKKQKKTKRKRKKNERESSMCFHAVVERHTCEENGHIKETTS